MWESAWEPTGIPSTSLSSRALVRLRSGRLVALFRGAPPPSPAFALDAACYHHGGPLADGDIEDFGGSACISCPWHHYKITLARGEALYVALDVASGARAVKSKGVRQRAHGVREDGAGLLWVADTGAARPAGTERDGDAAVRAGLGEPAGELWLAMERAAAAAAGGALPSDAYSMKQGNNSLRFGCPGEAPLGEGGGLAGAGAGAPPLHSRWGASGGGGGGGGGGGSGGGGCAAGAAATAPPS